MEIDAASLTHQATYKLLTGAVVPRPIAWVSSGVEPGKINLAPFSTFTFVSPFPPMLGFNCGMRGNERKDTSRNIQTYGEYVINIADRTMMEAMHESSADHAPEISEVELLGLETAPSVKIRTPRLAKAPISMECRLHQVLSFGATNPEFFVGEVLMFHVRDDLYKDGKIDTRLLDPICRLGGPTYATLGEIITLRSVGSLPGG
jgi:flavin reductase (DIM6/NTAB) family NADH-FMN oxidoreductase RutF